MKKKIDWQVVHIPTRSEIRADRYRDRIYQIDNVILSLDKDEYEYVIRVLNRESSRLLRLLNKEGFDD